MAKKTKKTTRKKNLSVKSNVQYVYNVNGERLRLEGGKLLQFVGGRTWRSVRLSDVRRAINNGYDEAVTVRYACNGKKTHAYEFEIGSGWTGYPEAVLNIGCQNFDETNAAKILKRAKVTV